MRLSYGNIGLGPNKLGILRYALPYNGVFHIAARYHDIAYGRGGSEITRQKIDLMFYRLMLSASQNSLQRLFAKLYYYLVQKFGAKHFVYIITEQYK